ncbi:MAG: hypothetical protein ACI4PG_08540 [Candidatus Ventricola sp.]
MRTLYLYGAPASRELAKLLLENLPQLRRIDASADLSEIKMLTASPIDEISLIPLLAQSGISGFRLV